VSAAPHTLLLASAGTGKTHRLTLRYLELVFAGVDPARILATTFTRKAAGEILQRVLVRLCDAAEQPAALEALRRDLRRPELDAAACRGRLRELLRGLERLRVSTLDAFFAGVARSAALDLGLPPGWTIADEERDRVLQREALSQALAEAAPGEIGALLAALQQDEARRAVHAALAAALQDGRELYHESDAAAWDRLRVPASPPDAEVAAAIAALERLALPTTGKGAENKTWLKARNQLVGVARGGDWPGFVGLTLVDKVVRGESHYSKVEIAPAWSEALAPLIARARSVILAALARENRGTRAWFERYERQLARLRRERGALRFEDLPQAIAPLARDPLAERGVDLWFRLDGAVDHLLLDEFQDTAPPQWRCVRPLAEELLADGSGARSFFCVGDAKQSIYGWRGAEPRLLEELPARYPVLGAPERLQRSWRSSQVVLDAVDRVFERLASNVLFAGEHEASAARRFQGRYAAHVAAKELPGAALLLEARAADDGEDDAAPLCERAVERVAALAAEAPAATIAILLRRNRLIPRLVRALGARGLRASGEGGNPLTDSAAVSELCALLRLADHPGDSAAAFHVAHAPLGAALGLAAGDEAGACRAGRAARAELATRGYGAWLARVHQRLAESAACGAWDLARFGQLVELGFAYDARATLRPADFVRHVAGARVEDPSSARIKIMTVHAAKGLEFDAVICPELEGLLSGRSGRFDWERERADGPVSFVTRHVDERRVRLDADLEALAHANGARRVEEALCLLYVAMTRAIHRLELIVPARDPAAEPTFSFAGLLRAALGPGPAVDGVLWAHERNAAAWFTPQRASVADAPEAGEVPRLHLAAGAPAARTPEPRSASAGRATVRAAQILTPPDRFGLARGALVHRWLAELEWLDAPAPDDTHLRALARGVEHDEEVVRAALASFRAALAAPAIAALLRRPAGAGGEAFEVWRERRFALHLPEARGAHGAEELWQGAFDRVVVARAGGRALRAELIDWKNEQLPAAEAGARAELHRGQLAAYRRVLARILDLEERRIRMVVAFLHPGVVVELPA